jgi:diacylglycerol kinase (ATP)
MKNSNLRICFIVNPKAGDHHSVQFIDWLNREAHKRWEHFEIVITRSGESVSKLAASKSALFDVIVACGGDGTIHQIVNGLAGTGTTLAVLPAGTGNDFAKSLRMDVPLPDALDLILEHQTREIDLIRCEGDVSCWCANTLGTGIDGLANYHAKKVKWVSGSLIYMIGALKAVFSFRGARIKLKIDQRKIEDDYLMITACNGKWEGGKFLLAPDASLWSRQMDLVMIRKIAIPTILLYLLRFRRGPARWMKHLTTLQTETAEITSDKPLSVHADGEYLGSNIRHLTLTVHKKALTAVIGH